jgi:hypothetical protein
MRNFNNRLANYLDEAFLSRVAREVSMPQSRRAAAKKLNISVYALKRLEDYNNYISEVHNA